GERACAAVGPEDREGVGNRRRLRVLDLPKQHPRDPMCVKNRIATRILFSVRTAPDGYLKMFTARAATRSTVIEEGADSAAIRSLAHRLSGIESVGLKAIELVKET